MLTEPENKVADMGMAMWFHTDPANPKPIQGCSAPIRIISIEEGSIATLASMYRLIFSWDCITTEIVIPVAIMNPISSKRVLLNALIDTGANQTFINRSTIKKLALPFLGNGDLSTPHDLSRQSDIYSAKVLLNKKTPPFEVNVVAFDDGKAYKAVIGMDILSKGDLSIYNLKGTTELVFTW